MLNWNNLLSHKRLGLEHETLEKSDAVRTDFQRDYDRIIFSSPFRRLQNKTQVFPLPGSIFVHNRLTHSLEVASVGRSLGNLLAAGLQQKHVSLPSDTLYSIGSIISAACIAHDLGNPPFGHSGEQTISHYFKTYDANQLYTVLAPEQLADFQNFEGNANAFRLLTHQFTGRRKGGFALTYATLGTLLKYPCSSTDVKQGRSPYEKYGVFQSELPVLEAVAKELGLKQLVENSTIYGRHPLVYLMEAADDICYQIVDLEDAHRLGILTAQKTKELMLAFFNDAEKAVILAQITGLDDENEQIVILRSRTINKLVDECMAVFWHNYNAIMNCDFHSSLTKQLTGVAKTALAEVSAVANTKIYNSREVIEIQIAGHRILSELLTEFISAMMNNNSLYTKQLLQLLPSQLSLSSANLYDNLFSIVDFISGMTDVYALEIYRKIKGISFSVIR
ncbi:MAG: deoxyguanosinetriphosphate triphosphohydrolase [Bacteroidales bacterium]|jgi:dGTPase|nr:deoxyguanosinetriphosphate triphosphohydrolase [Bacteroidales bacterium]